MFVTALTRALAKTNRYVSRPLPPYANFLIPPQLLNSTPNHYLKRGHHVNNSNIKALSSLPYTAARQVPTKQHVNSTKRPYVRSRTKEKVQTAPKSKTSSVQSIPLKQLTQLRQEIQFGSLDAAVEHLSSLGKQNVILPCNLLLSALEAFGKALHSPTKGKFSRQGRPFSTESLQDLLALISDQYGKNFERDAFLRYLARPVCSTAGTCYVLAYNMVTKEQTKSPAALKILQLSSMSARAKNKDVNTPVSSVFSRLFQSIGLTKSVTVAGGKGCALNLSEIFTGDKHLDSDLVSLIAKAFAEEGLPAWTQQVLAEPVDFTQTETREQWSHFLNTSIELLSTLDLTPEAVKLLEYMSSNGMTPDISSLNAVGYSFLRMHEGRNKLVRWLDDLDRASQAKPNIRIFVQYIAFVVNRNNWQEVDLSFKFLRQQSNRFKLNSADIVNIFRRLTSNNAEKNATRLLTDYILSLKVARVGAFDELFKMMESSNTDPQYAIELLGIMKAQDIGPTQVTVKVLCDLAVSHYGKSSSVVEHKVFYAIRDLASTSWSPDALSIQTLNALLRLCFAANRMSSADWILKRLTQATLDQEDPVLSLTIKRACRWNADMANRYLDTLQKHGIRPIKEWYMRVVKSYFKANLPTFGGKIYTAMCEAHGVDAEDYRWMVRMLSLELGNPALAEEYMNAAIEAGIVFTSEEYGEVIRAYAKAARPVDALRLIFKVREIEGITISSQTSFSCISSLCNSFHSAEATIYASLLAQEGEDLEDRTISTLVACQSELGDFKAIEQIMAVLQSKNKPVPNYVCDALLKCYVQMGRLKRAEAFLHTLEVEYVETGEQTITARMWAHYLGGMVYAGHLERVRALYKEISASNNFDDLEMRIIQVAIVTSLKNRDIDWESNLTLV